MKLKGFNLTNDAAMQQLLWLFATMLLLALTAQQDFLHRVTNPINSHMTAEQVSRYQTWLLSVRTACTVLWLPAHNHQLVISFLFVSCYVHVHPAYRALIRAGFYGCVRQNTDILTLCWVLLFDGFTVYLIFIFCFSLLVVIIDQL